MAAAAGAGAALAGERPGVGRGTGPWRGCGVLSLPGPGRELGGGCRKSPGFAAGFGGSAGSLPARTRVPHSALLVLALAV